MTSCISQAKAAVCPGLTLDSERPLDSICCHHQTVSGCTLDTSVGSYNNAVLDLAWDKLRHHNALPQLELTWGEEPSYKGTPLPIQDGGQLCKRP